jgi:NADPH:quinone reductase and related Zn-dependent oxidoreductases
MLAVIFDQSITARDVVGKAVLRDHLTVQPHLVLLDGVESAVYLGLLWVQPGRILGTTALGKVLSVGLDLSRKIEGRKVLVFPYSVTYGGLGTEIDGVMAEEAVVPHDTVVEVPEEADWRYLFLPHLSIIEQLKRLAKGLRVLVVGTGLLGSLALSLLRNDAVRIGALYDQSITLEGVERVREISGEWELVFLSSMKTWIRGEISRLSSPPTVVIPRVSRSWPLNITKNVVELFPRISTNLQGLLESKEVTEVLNKVVGFSDDILSSIPTPKAGVVVDFQKALPKLKVMESA